MQCTTPNLCSFYEQIKTNGKAMNNIKSKRIILLWQPKDDAWLPAWQTFPLRSHSGSVAHVSGQSTISCILMMFTIVLISQNLKYCISLLPDSPPSSNSHQTSTVPFPCFLRNCWLASSSLWSDTFSGTVGLFLSAGMVATHTNTQKTSSFRCNIYHSKWTNCV